jgi:hypothetical protein
VCYSTFITVFCYIGCVDSSNNSVTEAVSSAAIVADRLSGAVCVPTFVMWLVHQVTSPLSDVGRKSIILKNLIYSCYFVYIQRVATFKPFVLLLILFLAAIFLLILLPSSLRILPPVRGFFLSD